jgi:hypothetical protein
MKTVFFRVVCGIGLVLGLATMAEAQATRTWVSGVGNDADPCSRTAPCKTFAGAQIKTAAGGFINVLDPGGFGAVTINKSLTIDGDWAHSGVLASLTQGIIVSAPGAIVNIRNIALESPQSASAGLNGIRVLNAAVVHVENVFIGGFSQKAIDFQPAGGGEGYFTDVNVSDNAGGGIVVTTGRVMVNRLKAESNSNGVLVNGNAIAVVRNSHASGGSIGFGASTTASAVLTVENSTTTHNDFGIVASQGATARVSDTVISNNTTGLFNDGGSFIVSLQGNEIIGNPTPGSFTSTIVKQ